VHRGEEDSDYTSGARLWPESHGPGSSGFYVFNYNIYFDIFNIKSKFIKYF
jgi:hypothetical protein